MATYTGHEIADIARNVYLNRAGLSDTALLPVINTVYEGLQQILIEHGAPIFKTKFAPITVTATVTFISYGSGTGAAGELPVDFVSPLKLWERAVGQTNVDYVPMTEKTELPFANQVNELLYWSWDEEAIKLIGATSTREVLISGYKMLPLLNEEKDTIAISYAKDYLAVATAAQAALSLSHNPTLAARLDTIATNKLDKMLSRYVKKDQSLPIRRRGYRRSKRHLA